ncbi:hypothetical protein V8E51_013777 [Hyaloscypha variabilis]
MEGHAALLLVLLAGWCICCCMAWSALARCRCGVKCVCLALNSSSQSREWFDVSPLWSRSTALNGEIQNKCHGKQ